MSRRKIIILGAAGRDFHNFNLIFKDNPRYEVVAFTATQIPGISGRTYPAKLAGKLYPRGIKIYPEEELPDLIKKFAVDEVVFSYSDVSHQYIMEKASLVMALGCGFRLLGAGQTMLRSKNKVIAVTAVRTGAGKSPTTRKVCALLKSLGKRVIIIRHPMPYSDLVPVQRFCEIEDMRNCTIEEREEYEHYIKSGFVVYAGTDYAKILRAAENEAGPEGIIVWDGGNNDTPFIKPDLHLVVADARRPSHELTYYPGLVNVLLADVGIVNKVDSAKPEDVQKVVANIKKLNPSAMIIKAGMRIKIDDPQIIKSKRVLVIEDGPTLTHGGLGEGAGAIAARNFKAKLIDPRPYAIGSIKRAYEDYKHLGAVLPALGYSEQQIKELERTINSVPCDAVILATPVDLSHFMRIKKPVAKVEYELEEVGKPDLKEIVEEFVKAKILDT